MKSGYPENYRKEVLQSSVIGYERQIAADEAGVTPLYRPRSWNKEERKNKKRLKKSSWYRPADVVLFVPATPEAELANKAREVVEGEGKRLDIKVKVVERGGPTMKQHLVRTDMKTARRPNCHNPSWTGSPPKPARQHQWNHSLVALKGK